MNSVGLAARLLAMSVFALGVQTPSTAQWTDTTTARAENARATTDLQGRLDATNTRILAAQRSGRITKDAAASLRLRTDRMRSEMTRFSRQQGFVSAGEIASYQRELGAIDVELDRLGVERGYGNDVLPSAEMTAFQQADARLGYRDARIDHDGRGCALYRGTASNGHVRTVPLLSKDGRPICVRH